METKITSLYLFEQIAEEVVTEPDCLVLMDKDLDPAFFVKEYLRRVTEIERDKETPKEPLFLLVNFSNEFQEYFLYFWETHKGKQLNCGSITRETVTKRSSFYARGKVLSNLATGD